MTEQPESAQQKRASGKPPPRPRKPVVVRVLRALARQNYCRKRTRGKEETQHQVNERMMARWTRKVGWFTGALVFVGLLSAWIFQGQLNTMQDQLDEMREQQRPFVFVKAIQILSNHKIMFSDELRWLPIFRWQNTGNNSTINLLLRFACVKSPTAIDAYEGAATRNLWTTQRSFLGPHEDSQIGGCVLTPEEMTAASLGQFHLYPVADAIYAGRPDGNGKMKFTEYCAELNVAKGNWSSDGEAPGYAETKCGGHNCVDEECPQKDRDDAAKAWKAAK